MKENSEYHEGKLNLIITELAEYPGSDKLGSNLKTVIVKPALI